MSIVRRWNPRPVRSLEADVPLPYRVAAAGIRTVSVTLNIGDTVTIDASGLVRNASGTALFRFAAAAEQEPTGGER